MSQREINCRGAERKVPEKSGERKNEIGEILPRAGAYLFCAPSIRITKEARAANESWRELRDKNYAAIKRDINTSCMRSAQSDPESRSHRNEDLARERRPRAR